jgi:hypothetical protein
MLEWLYENEHPISFISHAYSTLSKDERKNQWLTNHGPFSLLII